MPLEAPLMLQLVPAMADWEVSQSVPLEAPLMRSDTRLVRLVRLG